MFWRTLRLVCACGVLAVSAAPACGGSASDSKPEAGGGSGARAGTGNGGSGSLPRAGSAGMQTEPVACGSQSCAGVQIPLDGFSPIPACCADAKTSHCGLDTSALSMYGAMFSEACQPLAQPGTPDATCPSSPSTSAGDTGLAITLPGCCRANHTCGYQLDKVLGIFQVGLGCVASEPFLDGEAPQPCGEPGTAGAGGDSGGGAGGESSAAGGDSSAAGGDSSAAGAGGVSGNGG